MAAASSGTGNGHPETHERLIRRMLPTLGSDRAGHSAASVQSVILGQIRGCRSAHAKTIVGTLCIYLRFLAARRVCRPGLDHALATMGELEAFITTALPRRRIKWPLADGRCTVKAWKKHYRMEDWYSKIVFQDRVGVKPACA